jgi:hypothetical protein
MKTTTSLIKQKNYIKIFLFFCLTLTIANCRKDDDEPAPIVYADENPLASYITSTGFSTISNQINAGDYEFGLVFSPNVNGNIKAITAKIPDTNGNLRVSIWDFDSKTILRTEILNLSTANTMITKSIGDLALQKDKKYMISMNSNDWYNRTKPDDTNATYPITTGNIKIFGYSWKSGTTQTFPNNEETNYYSGDLSFVFQQTN